MAEEINAISMFFFFLSCFICTNYYFPLFLGSSYDVKAQGGRRRRRLEATRMAMTTKTSPNDASCVVWAIGMFTFVLYILTNTFLLF